MRYRIAQNLRADDASQFGPARALRGLDRTGVNREGD